MFLTTLLKRTVVGPTVLRLSAVNCWSYWLWKQRPGQQPIAVRCFLQSSFGAVRQGWNSNKMESVCNEFPIEWGQIDNYMQIAVIIQQKSQICCRLHTQKFTLTAYIQSPTRTTQIFRNFSSNSDCRMAIICKMTLLLFSNVTGIQLTISYCKKMLCS